MGNLSRLTALLLGGGALWAATFGTVVAVDGGASDIVLDEARGRLYLTVPTKNILEVYSIPQRRFLNSIRLDATPLTAAMSRSGRVLYVAAHDASALNVVNLDTLAVIGRVALPAKPEGVAVGSDERVLVSTIGTGAGNLQNILLIYNPDDNSINNTTINPPPPTPPQLPPPVGRPALGLRSKLVSTPDGRFIIGVNMPNTTQRSLFVYETASATVLRSRRVGNLSNVLSVSPDGSRFMAGLTLFETSSLAVLAQQNLANAPYPIAPNTNFNLQQNQGGSIFSPDGKTLYSAFNIVPTANPATRPNVSQLMLSDPENLSITMGIQVTENLAGTIVVSSDGGNLYALSESGFVILPMSTLNQQPLVNVNRDLILLTNDQCGVMADQRVGRLEVTNAGRGRVTATASLLQFPATGPGGLGGAGGAGGGNAGGGVIIVIPVVPGLPGGGGTTPTIPGGGGQTNTGLTQSQPGVRATNTAQGTNIDFTFSTVAARALGTISPVHDFLIQSQEAVNLAPRVRILQNNRNAESRGDLVPIPVGISSNEALEDLVYDSNRQRLYIANSGLNRVDVFDMRTRRLMNPIKVGQLPRSMALTPDGRTLYVANTGGESISIVDVERMETVGRVKFPPVPFDANATLVTPAIIAASQRGAMFLTNTGQLWSIIGDQAVPRRPSTTIGVNAAGQQNVIPAPRAMASTPNGEKIIIFGNGTVYLYDAAVDDFIQSRSIQAANAGGYIGPISAGPRGQYFVVNGIVLNQALTPVAQAPQQPGVGTAAAAGIPIAAVTAMGNTSYARFSQPLRANANALPQGTPSVELVDVNTGLATRTVSALEGPISTVAGANARAVISGRTMAVDATLTNAYILTSSGLSIVPLDTPAIQDRPAINQRGIVNYGSYLQNFSQNGLITIFGRNLGQNSATDAEKTLPTLAGGVCVTADFQGATAAQAATQVSRVLPLMMTSNGQLNAQLPPDLTVGNYSLVIRAIDRKVATVQQTIRVERYAPAVLVDTKTNLPQIFHADGFKQVSKDSPARRDEKLYLYAVGLGIPKGNVRLQPGQPAPSSPLAETEKVQVFFGDPRIKEAEIIVDRSILEPGLVGVYRLELRVPGDRIRGEDLPVTLRIGNVSSPTTGPAAPKIAVQ